VDLGRRRRGIDDPRAYSTDASAQLSAARTLEDARTLEREYRACLAESVR
jgi:hypothetical protein